MTKHGIEIFQVDAFTSEPFRGNPAAVCPLQGPGDAAWMQAVALEMNLSETAFLWPEGDGYRLRWFTPAVEVDLCGHATLASAHVLWETGAVPSHKAISFHTRSGTLTASPAQGGGGELDFPAIFAEPAELSGALASAFRVTPRYVGRVPGGSLLGGTYLLELESEQAVRALAPELASLRHEGGASVAATARSSGNWDFVSRFFAPGLGIDEDPVTGSAHCLLATYWAQRMGKNTLTGYQASRRGGVVGVTVANTRVRLRGQAVTVLRGQLLAAP